MGCGRISPCCDRDDSNRVRDWRGSRPKWLRRRPASSRSATVLRPGSPPSGRLEWLLFLSECRLWLGHGTVKQSFRVRYSSQRIRTSPPPAAHEAALLEVWTAEHRVGRLCACAPMHDEIIARWQRSPAGIEIYDHIAVLVDGNGAIEGCSTGTDCRAEASGHE